MRQLIFQNTLETRTLKALRTGLFILLFGIGATGWIFFLHRGQIAFNHHDWPKEYQYYNILKTAIQNRVIPYHVSEAFHGTHRFLALPETVLAPQIFLLSRVGIGQFIVINTLLLYSLGFIGCLLIWRRYQLSFFAFTVLFLLFNFNGHITAHLAAGHSMWTGYFLLPFFAFFVLNFAEGRGTLVTAISLSFVLWLMCLQGSFHLYIWCTVFLLLLAANRLAHSGPILWSIFFSFLLGLFRIVPAAITFWNIQQNLRPGYPTLLDLLTAFVSIQSPDYQATFSWLSTPGWWEYNIYTGIIGLAFLIFFGIYLRFSREESLLRFKYPWLDLPLLVMAVFSLSYFYLPIAKLPIPLISSERVPSRFLIIPVVILLVVSCIRMQPILNKLKKHTAATFVACAGIIAIFFTLITHSYAWRLSRLEELAAGPIKIPVIDVIHKTDPIYVHSLEICAIISLISAVVLLVMLFFNSRVNFGPQGQRSSYRL